MAAICLGLNELTPVYLTAGGNLCSFHQSVPCNFQETSPHPLTKFHNPPPILSCPNLFVPEEYPRLTDDHHRRHRVWARRHRNWNHQHWSHVIFADESRFSPSNSPHKGHWRGALMFSLTCALNKPLSKQSWGWWFETPSRFLWRHWNIQV